MSHGEDAWGLLSPPPGSIVHWLALRAGKASGGVAHTPEALSLLVHNLPDFNLHLGIHLVSVNQRYRPRSNEITHFTNLFLDIDPIAPDASPFKYAEELVNNAEVLLNTRLHPYLIDSGRGAQLWLPLSHAELPTTADRQRWRALAGLFLRRLRARTPRNFGCDLDTSTADLPRVGRLIGSTNHKTGRRARLLSSGVRSASLRGALISFGNSESSSLTEHLTKYVGQCTPSRWQMTVDLLPSVTARRFLTEGVPEPGRHAAAWHTAAALSDLGVPLEGALKAVRFGARLCQPALRAGDAERAVRCAYTRFRMEAMDGNQGRSSA